jgi:P27 family predicted phage terminase small subunit
MPAGRPRKPTALKLITGEKRPSRLNPNEPKPKKLVKTPSPPPHLGKIAKAEWRRVAKPLHSLGLLSIIDMEILAQYCKAVQDEREACGRLAHYNMNNVEHPNLLPPGRAGTYTTHPYVHHRNEARKQIAVFAREFGMTPSARSRVQGAVPKNTGNKFDRFK